MTRREIDHEAVHLERRKCSLRFWGVIGLILLSGATYSAGNRGWAVGWFEWGYAVGGILCLAIAVWQFEKLGQ